MHTVLGLLMGIPHECELLVTQEVQLGSEKTQLGLGFQGKLKKRNRWNSVMANRTPSQAALVVKDLPANAGDTRDMGSTPGLGRSPEGGHDNPLQYSCLENPMDRGAWRATVHRVTKSQIQLSDLVCTHILYSKDILEFLDSKSLDPSSSLFLK